MLPVRAKGQRERGQIPQAVANANIKELEAELKELQEEDAKDDPIRRLSLHYIAGRFCCPDCFDSVYNYRERQKKH